MNRLKAAWRGLKHWFFVDMHSAKALEKAANPQTKIVIIDGVEVMGNSEEGWSARCGGVGHWSWSAVSRENAIRGARMSQADREERSIHRFPFF